MDSRKKLKQKLDQIGVQPKKSLGQNFLVDDFSVQEVIGFAELHSEDSCIELGPGAGAITSQLIDASKSYLGLELQKDLYENLVRKFSDKENAEFLNIDLTQYQIQAGRDYAIVGNVPYSISSEICLWLLDSLGTFSRACLLLQKEFAERLAARPGTRGVGSLSVLMQSYGEVSLGPVISGDKFHPRARVDSQLLRFKPFSEPILPKEERSSLEKVLRAAFSTRRKTLLNSLQILGIEKAELETRLSGLGIDPGWRVEKLSLKQFHDLRELLE